MNPNPVTFHYIPTVRAQGKVIQPHAERKVSDKSIINIINSLWKKNNPEYWKEGNRAESIFKLACLMCNGEWMRAWLSGISLKDGKVLR